MTYEVLNAGAEDQRPIKAWTNGVSFDQNAQQQVRNVASLPFIYKHVAVMPDVHWGIGATVGSVIPTVNAVIPAAVGVDIGCGMAAVRLEGLRAHQLPDNLAYLRSDIEAAVPVGRADHKESAQHTPPDCTAPFLLWLDTHHPKLARTKKRTAGETISAQLGTLGSGNHFIELCLDEADDVWLMLHSGSRGIGNRIGHYFIELAREDMRLHHVNLPDRDLAYFGEGTQHFEDYIIAVHWAQDYAMANRRDMLGRIIDALRDNGALPTFEPGEGAVRCHHNYVALEHHFGRNVWVTRKGAVRAREYDLGIIPGSMGARSYIVRGKGNQDSFHSCSHGAGRVMSRGHAKKRITVEDHMLATAGVECRKDKGVIDESPAAYKSIDAVMAAQEDLVDVVSEQENSFNIVARRPRGAGQQHTGAHLDAGHRRLPFKQILEAKSGSANSEPHDLAQMCPRDR